MVSIQVTIALCVITFLIGRAAQNWSNKTGEADRMAYRAGLEDGRTGKERQQV